MIGELFRSTPRADDECLISQKWDRRVFGAMLVWVAITGITTLLIAGWRYFNP